MAAPLRRVLMRRPGESLRAADPAAWGYGPAFEPGRALAEYEAFARIVEASGAEVLWWEDAGDGLADAMFTRDAALITEAGAVGLNMGKPLRRAEPARQLEILEEAGVPILGRIEGDALAEGGDLIWLDPRTLLIGFGFRSNRDGARRLQALLAPQGVEVIGFDLPYGDGPEACLHLMSLISPLDEDLYLIHAPLTPAPLWSLLRARGIALIAAPAAEIARTGGLSLNVLPLRPRACVMIDGAPQTQAALEAAGVSVETFPGEALCVACEGGPTCLTNPILRR